MICSKSVIYGCGYLNRVKLKQSKDGYIYGYLSIKTSPKNIVSFNVYQHEITKNNKINPSYKCFNTVMNEYKDSTTGNPDFVEIKLKESFPNSEIYFRESVFKNLKFVTRTEEKKTGIMFKIYGIRVDEIDGQILKCSFLGYNNIIRELEIINKTNHIIESGSIIDATGYVREGLENGIPVDEFHLKNVRDSELNVNFELGIKYIKNDADPF